MWEDVFSENFIDTLYLLAIPGLACSLTLMAHCVNALVKRNNRKKEERQRVEMHTVPSLAVIEAAEEFEHQVDDRKRRVSRVEFGLSYGQEDETGGAEDLGDIALEVQKVRSRSNSLVPPTAKV